MWLQVGILAELHWELPHALSPAELSLRNVQLPRLEKLQQSLAADMEVGQEACLRVSVL